MALNVQVKIVLNPMSATDHDRWKSYAFHTGNARSKWLNGLRNQRSKNDGNTSVISILQHRTIACAFVLTSASFWTAFAQAQPAAPAGGQAGVSIELNKLEQSEKGCRAFMVLNNGSESDFSSFKIDLVIFQTDGVIGKRFSIDLAPLRSKKKSVKLFEIDGTHCDKIGSLLINDVMDCKAGGAAVPSCLADLKASSLSQVQLSK
jgi:hypothetical protein